LIVSLKRSASCCLKVLMFLSEEYRIRLKSPSIIQAVFAGGCSEVSSSRKDCLRAWSVGA
jgi:hypothetical protein